MKTASPRREGSGGKDTRNRLGKWAEVMEEGGGRRDVGGQGQRGIERVCRYRLSAFGEFYKIHQEVLETEGTMALTVVVKETPLRDFHYKTHKVL